MSAVLDQGTAAASPDAPVAEGKKKKKKSKKKLLLIVLVVVLLAGGGGYEFLMGGKKPAAGAKAPAPKPGPLVTPDAITINLAGGHYLRIALALQFTSKVSAAAPPDGAPALDQAISYLTGQSAAQLETPAGLATVKSTLLARIAPVYPKDPLMGVLITSFVIQ